jgi:hypothetical protein
MITSEQTSEIFAALTEAQGEMPTVYKGATNPHFKSKYASLEEVSKAAQPILAKHGLGIVVGCEQAADPTVAVAIRVIHKSGQWIESIQYMKPRANTPQDVGSCITYASRYGYRMVGVVTDEDDDGNSVSVEKPKAKPQSSKLKPADPPKDPPKTEKTKLAAFQDACAAIDKRSPDTISAAISAWHGGKYKTIEAIPAESRREFFTFVQGGLA